MASTVQSQRLDRFAAALSAATGLTYDAARTWATAEVGINNNLGIMDSPSQPHAFSTPEEGAAAAAKLINTSPLYAGIRSSVSSRDTHTELLAIAQSPWHLGPSGLAKAGGTDPYYAGIFGLPKSNPPVTPVGKGFGVSGGNTGNTDPGPSQQTTQYTIIDWLTGRAEAGVATDFAKGLLLDGVALFIGIIFVIIGLIMFLKGTSSPTEAVRGVANDAIGTAKVAAAAAVDPALAAGVASAGKGSGAPRPNINVNNAAGMRDSAPAGQSTETPRTRLPQSYYHNRLNRVRVTVVRKEPKGIGSGIKLVGPGMPVIPMPGAISLPGAIELNPPQA